MDLGVPAPPTVPLRTTATLILSALVAALGGLLFGFDTAVIAGTTYSLTQVFSLSAATLGVTVSSALWGTIGGALLGGWTGERFGRATLRVMALLYLFSAIGCALAGNWYFLLAARIIGGLGIGGPPPALFILPSFSGAASRQNGGVLSTECRCRHSAGLPLELPDLLRHLGATEWRWQLAVPALPSAAFLLLLFAIPRSPRWLAKQKQYGAARMC